MHIAIEVVALATVVSLVSAGARRYGLSAPLLLVLTGIVASYLWFVPRVQLTSEVVLVGFLPPLLYATSIRTSLVDFRRNRRAIGLLSVGLVAFTMLGVGLIAWWLLPIPLAAAMALGAIVAPTDAVAATAIARRVGMPRRIVAILQGESLLNDATALVGLRMAMAALAGALDHWWEVGLDFLRAVGGGVVVGIVVALVLAKFRKHITDPVLDTSLSLMAPWIAYVPAEEVHGSGVLAVVVTGLILGHKAPVLQSAASRISERTNWRTVEFLLENAVFLLIGLQARWIVEALSESTLPTDQIVIATVGVFAAVVLLRPIWVFPATYIPRLIPAIRRADPSPPWTAPAVISWAGMRGVVTLAAVFVLEEDTAYREVLVFIALAVVAGSLLLQGTTLPWLVSRLNLQGRPDPAEDALQEAAILQAAHKSAWRELQNVLTEDDDPKVVRRLKMRAEARTQAAWERLGRPESEAETPSEAYRRLRMVMLQAERQYILKVRDKGLVADEVLQRALSALDIEESILDRSEEDDVGGRNDDLQAPPQQQAHVCEHLAAAPVVTTPNTPDGCEECLADGGTWVHLRLCLQCGHVGCCDSSPARHASKHFAAEGHPVMRSFEPGESWRWCFVDNKLG